MHRFLSNTGPSSAAAPAAVGSSGSNNPPMAGERSLVDQQELNSGLADLLGEWDEEEKKVEVQGFGTTGSKMPTTIQNMPAQSVSGGRKKPTDLDDMDANLFDSFSLTSRRREKKATEPEMMTNLPLDKPVSSLKKSAVKKHTGSDDDDLFDLLAEEKEDTHRTRQRPKFRAKSRHNTSSSSAEAGKDDPEVTVSGKEDFLKAVPEEPTERPKSRKGQVKVPENVPETITTSLQSTARSGGTSGPDILTLGDSGTRGEERKIGGFKQRGRSEGKILNDEFDMEDEDDLLSGMGLDDGKPNPISTQKTESSATPTPKMPQKSSIQTNGEEVKAQFEEKDPPKSVKAEDHEESFMFGSYTPSISGPRRRGLPTGSSTGGSSLLPERPAFSSAGERHKQTSGTEPSELKLSQAGREAEKIPEGAQKAKHSKTEVKAASEAVGRPTKKFVRFAESTDSPTATQALPQPQQFVRFAESTDSPTATQALPQPQQSEVLHKSGRRMEETTEPQQELIPSPKHSDERDSHPVSSGPKLEHPVFPWQQRQQRRHGLADNHGSTNPLHTATLTEGSPPPPTPDKEPQLEMRRQRTKNQEPNSQLEELRAKVISLECERDQLKTSLENMKACTAEEQATIDKSHSARIQSLEESFQRREAKWREELETEAAHHRERLEQADREKNDSLLALRKKMEALELSKTNEIAQLQQIHRSAVADMKREHEVYLNHLKETHRQEIEALRAAHSHTQQLSELSSQVEETIRTVSGLQARVEQTHRQSLEDSHQNSITHQQHLKTLEERLNKQYRDMESQRQLLRSVASQLETYLSQQTQSLEQERWSLQQESARLKAAERALGEERDSQLKRLEQERREMTDSKERFLVEQQKLLSECFSERHLLAGERAQLELEQKTFAELEKRETQKRKEMEAECEAMLARVSEEKARLSTEAAQLEQKESRLRAESARVDQERLAVERDRADLLDKMNLAESSGHEANRLNQSAMALQREGKEQMEAAQRLQAELAEQAELIKRERHELEQRESQLVTERLDFARECREHQENQQRSEFTHPHPSPILTSTKRMSSTFPAVSDLSQSLPQPLRLSSNRQDHHMQKKAAENSQQQSHHQDEQSLREEREFLDAIQHQTSLMLINHYNRPHLPRNK